MPRILFVLLILCIYSCSGNEAREDKPAEKQTPSPTLPSIQFINYSVVASYPHDISSFTEGLLVHEGKIYESTGAPNYLPQTRSLAGVLDLKTGKIDKKVEIDKKQYFGEGIVILNGKLYQLTYDTKVGFEYDLKSFRELRKFSFPSKEGWGMTTDGTHLIMSDGTNIISYLDPADFKVVKTLSVTEDGYAREYLNELEYVNGFIYANVWMTNLIVKIDPKSSRVVGKIDLGNLANEAKSKHKGSLEMNGIAYNPATKTFYVTGKMWPSLYEIKFEH